MPIVTGDTKVVERGKGDGVFITTTGVGVVPHGVDIAADRARPGDAVLLSGSIGDHGTAVLSRRENLSFETEIRSDSAALHGLVAAMVEAVPDIHVMRDPTRGGLAALLNEIAREVAGRHRRARAGDPDRHRGARRLRAARPRSAVRRQRGQARRLLCRRRRGAPAGGDARASARPRRRDHRRGDRRSPIGFVQMQTGLRRQSHHRLACRRATAAHLLAFVRTGFVPSLKDLQRQQSSGKAHLGIAMLRTSTKKPRVIAIDGPAAAGKGTLARRLADHLGYAYLDTGLLYRAVGMRTIEAGGDPCDSVAATAAAEDLAVGELARSDLRSDVAAKAASQVAATASVRRALLAFQRQFAENPPEGAAGAVLDGRDIGTVVCPRADLKLFVTASPEVRAARRLKELRERGSEAIDTRVLREMRERDARDSARIAAPLAPASDAIVIDTTGLDPEAVFVAALAAFDTAKPSD